MESCDNLMMNTYHFDSNDLLDVKPSPSGWEDDEAWEDETEPTDVVGGMDCPVPQMKDMESAIQDKYAQMQGSAGLNISRYDQCEEIQMDQHTYPYCGSADEYGYDDEEVLEDEDQFMTGREHSPRAHLSKLMDRVGPPSLAMSALELEADTVFVDVAARTSVIDQHMSPGRGVAWGAREPLPNESTEEWRARRRQEQLELDEFESLEAAVVEQRHGSPSQLHQHQPPQQEQQPLPVSPPPQPRAYSLDALQSLIKPAYAARPASASSNHEQALPVAPHAFVAAAAGGPARGDVHEEDAVEALVTGPPPAAATHFDDASEWGASPVSSRAAPYPSHGGDPGKVARACFANDEAQTATSSLPPAAAPQDKPSKLMQQLFFTHKEKEPARPRSKGEGNKEGVTTSQAVAELEAAASEKVRALEAEIAKFQTQNRLAEDARRAAEAAANQLASDRAAFEQAKAADTAVLEEQKAEHQRKCARDKRVLEKQQRQLLKLPSKAQRTEVEVLQAALDKAQDDMRAREARHKLTAQRMRKQKEDLEEQNRELRDMVRRLEERLLEVEPRPRAGSTASARQLGASLPQHRADASARSMSPGQTGQSEAASGRVSTRRAQSCSDDNNSRRLTQPPREEAQNHESSTVSRPALERRSAGNGRYAAGAADGAASLGGDWAREDPGVQLDQSGGSSDGEGPVQSEASVSHQLQNLKSRRASKRSNGRYASSANPQEVPALDLSAYQPKKFDPPSARAGAAEGGAARASRVDQSNDSRAATSARRRDDQVPNESFAPDPPDSSLADMTRTVYAPRPSLGSYQPGDESAELAQEVHYPDGKSERVYIDGRRSVCFANGTRKETLSPQNGGGAVVFFINGDLKRSYPNHLRVDYYYSEVDTWHTTHTDGTEVFHFPGGQTEVHNPDGSKDIRFPDGSVRHIETLPTQS